MNFKMAARKNSKNSYLQGSTLKTAYQVLLLVPLSRNPTKTVCHLETEMTHTHTKKNVRDPIIPSATHVPLLSLSVILNMRIFTLCSQDGCFTYMCFISVFLAAEARV